MANNTVINPAFEASTPAPASASAATVINGEVGGEYILLKWKDRFSLLRTKVKWKLTQKELMTHADDDTFHHSKYCVQQAT